MAVTKRVGTFLSRGEVELIQHRLDVPECIADALAEEFDAEMVEVGIEIVQAAMDRGASVMELLSLRDESGAAWDVLVEAMEGSTWVNSDLLCGTHLDRIAYRAACRAADRLEERFGRAIEEHADRMTRFTIPRR